MSLIAEGWPERLPGHPQPENGESLTSWLIRTAYANAERLSYITNYLTGKEYFWVHDRDRLLSEELAARFEAGTGIETARLQQLVLAQFAGKLFDRLEPQGSVRWLLPLAKQGLRASRRGALYCPFCLAEDERPYLRLHWRFSFMVACPVHETGLLDACPHCHHPFAPYQNDLGYGRHWYLEAELPFMWCPQCGGRLEARPERVSPAVLELQRRMMLGLTGGTMKWDGLGQVPSKEGFDVLHQLLAVLLRPEMRQALDFLPDAPVYPERRNRSFEDFSLAGRTAFMGRLAYLVQDWPERFVDVIRQAGLTRGPLVYNMPEIPSWYDRVVDQFSQANGRRAYKVVPLVPHLTLDEIAKRRDSAKTELERRRWNVLWHYAQQPEKLPIARKLGEDVKFVHGTVSRYNAQGPGALENARRGKEFRQKRLLTVEQEQELRTLIDTSLEPLSNAQLADWFEARIGKRPDRSTLWMYRRI